MIFDTSVWMVTVPPAMLHVASAIASAAVVCPLASISASTASRCNVAASPSGSATGTGSAAGVAKGGRGRGLRRAGGLRNGRFYRDRLIRIEGGHLRIGLTFVLRRKGRLGCDWCCNRSWRGCWRREDRRGFGGKYRGPILSAAAVATMAGDSTLAATGDAATGADTGAAFAAGAGRGSGAAGGIGAGGVAGGREAASANGENAAFFGASGAAKGEAAAMEGGGGGGGAGVGVKLARACSGATPAPRDGRNEAAAFAPSPEADPVRKPCPKDRTCSTPLPAGAAGADAPASRGPARSETAAPAGIPAHQRSAALFGGSGSALLR